MMRRSIGMAGMLAALALAGPALFGPALAQDRQAEPRGLISLWQSANSLCRGGSGDNPENPVLCEVRDSLVGRIQSFGWCYGQRGQIGAQMQWHRCGQNSLR